MIPRAFAVVVLTAALALAAACGDDGEEDLPRPTPGDGTPSPTETTPPNGGTPTPAGSPSEPTPTPDSGPATEAAIDALATWLGPAGDRDSIEVSSVEAVVWPDGCLGISRVGQACTDALVEGFRIELALGEGLYEVRTDTGGTTTVWAPSVEAMVSFQEGLTNLFLFTTDDGNELEAQPVPGTDFGVDPQTLSAGDPVGIALADAPQDGPQLLVWIDPVGP